MKKKLRGKKFYHNYKEQIRLNKGDDVPEGFVPGLLKDALGNGANRKKSKEQCKRQSNRVTGEGNQQYGKKLYHKGETHKWFAIEEEIPNGFIPGLSPKTKYKHQQKSAGKNNGCYGKKCYNNGIINKFFREDEEIPNGFVKGRLQKNLSVPVCEVYTA